MVEPVESAGVSAVRRAVDAFTTAADGVGRATSTADARTFPPREDLEGNPLEEFPPAFVFAPGFLHADRRGLVPYPGLQLGDRFVSMVLARRWVSGGVGVVDASSELYSEVVRLARSGDDPQSS